MTRCCTLQRLLCAGRAESGGCAGIAVASASGLCHGRFVVPETSDVSHTVQQVHHHTDTARWCTLGAVSADSGPFFCPHCASDKDRNTSWSVHESDPGIQLCALVCFEPRGGHPFPVISDNCARRLRMAVILLYLYGPMRRRSVPGMW